LVVLISCWSATGGAGTTVVSSCLALLRAARHPAGALLVDLAGDVPSVLGIPDVVAVPDPDRPGVAEWLAAGHDVPADALARLEVPARAGLAILRRGDGPLTADRVEALAPLLVHDPRPVVADCGTRPTGVRAVLVRAATTSLLVTRLCYVALRRLRHTSLRPTGVVVVREPGRALTGDDVEKAAEAPVVAHVEHDPAVARAVDAGLLTARRLPRSIDGALRALAGEGRRRAA
jgi:MinD-like ATPase involved in chromosome partitioning or flagellar assembly